MVKLSNSNMAGIVKSMKTGSSTEYLAKLYGVSQRRVQQIAKEYSEQGRIPKLNPNRRPRTELTEEQKKAIEKAWDETRLDSKLLYWEMRRRGTPVPKSKLISYLRDTGKSVPNPKKQKKRKRCRYERDHSCSLVHGDIHRRTENDPYAVAWLDDASRKVLAMGEFDSATSDRVVATFEEARSHIKEFNADIREVNTDRGSQFFSNKNYGTSEFQRHLEKERINHIPSRRNNPQTNGKLERFWLEYDRHRFRFPTLREFVDWYNNRIHGALWLEIGENPNMAFVRKLPPESLLGLFMKIIGE